MTTVLLATSICAGIFLATWLGGHRVANAQTGGVGSSAAIYRQLIRIDRHLTDRALENRCRPGHWWRPLRQIPKSRLAKHRRWVRHEKREARDLSSLCGHPKRIIRQVFPDATEQEAIGVARCESGLRRYAHNPSGASGIFQLMPMHFTRPGPSFDPFQPLLNAQYARRLSRSGYDWSAWVCNP